MAFQFPPSPVVDQTFTPVPGTTYRWSGTAWHLLSAFIAQAEAQNTTNRIINGKMAIDQRRAGGGMSVTSVNALYALDRWATWASGAGTYNILQSTNIPRAGEFALTLSVVTADTSLAAGDFYFIGQSVEGYNIADLNLGSANAQTFIFAFEALSSVAGTFALAFRNIDGTRSYVTTFTLPANVFTSITATIPGDAAGTWNTTNGAGMHISFSVGAGTTSNTPAPNVWQAGNFTSVAGTVNWMGTASAVFRLANVRLYKGSVDYGPDRRLYAEELALCQRYFCKSYTLDIVPGAVSASGTTVLNVFTGTAGGTFYAITYPVRMRAAPTVTLYPDVGTITAGNWQQAGVLVPMVAHGGFSNDRVAVITNTNAITPSGFIGGHFTASAEL